MGDPKDIPMERGVFKRDFRNHLGVLTLKGHRGAVKSEKASELLEPDNMTQEERNAVAKDQPSPVDKQVTGSSSKSKKRQL